MKHSISPAPVCFLMQGMNSKGKTESTESNGDSQAKALEDELLQDPPKGNLDKMRVLRSRLKRLSSKLPDRVVGSSTGIKQTPAGGPEGPDLHQVGSSLSIGKMSQGCSHDSCQRGVHLLENQPM